MTHTDTRLAPNGTIIDEPRTLKKKNGRSCDLTLETPFEADMSRERWCSGLARNQVRNWGLNVSQAGIYLGIHSLYAVRPCAH